MYRQYSVWCLNAKQANKKYAYISLIYFANSFFLVLTCFHFISFSYKIHTNTHFHSFFLPFHPSIECFLLCSKKLKCYPNWILFQTSAIFQEEEDVIKIDFVKNVYESSGKDINKEITDKLVLCVEKMVLNQFY